MQSCTLSHALNHDDHFQYLPDGHLLWLPLLGTGISDQAGHHDQQHPVLHHPDRIGRTDQAVSFVYTWSRFSAIFTGFVIAFVLGHSGVAGVFAFIAAAMLAVALKGPRTRNLALEQISN
jgi:hypothetical protein